jgi:transcriptional/translational regulatory protein YebC/TACO1
MFEKGACYFRRSSVSGKAHEGALEAGAEDVTPNQDDNVFEVYTDPTEFHKVKTSFDAAGLKYSQADITMVPKNSVKVEGKAAKQVLNLLEELEDLDDVQTVYANFDISEEEMAAMA